MRTLNGSELVFVAGGDNPSMGPYEPPAGNSGAACGNAMIVWGGIGASLGSLGGGGIIGFFAGAAGGGWLASRFSICQY